MLIWVSWQVSDNVKPLSGYSFKTLNDRVRSGSRGQKPPVGVGSGHAEHQLIKYYVLAQRVLWPDWAGAVAWPLNIVGLKTPLELHVGLPGADWGGDSPPPPDRAWERGRVSQLVVLHLIDSSTSFCFWLIMVLVLMMTMTTTTLTLILMVLMASALVVVDVPDIATTAQHFLFSRAAISPQPQCNRDRTVSASSALVKLLFSQLASYTLQTSCNSTCGCRYVCTGLW